MSLRIVCKAAATTFLSLTVSLGAAADDRLLTIDDLLALKSVSDPQINSDGDWIAYTVDSIDVEADTSSKRSSLSTPIRATASRGPAFNVTDTSVTWTGTERRFAVTSPCRPCHSS
jgi:dipeptidyl aminopeptidase/acylaminoacyl peptidase